MCEVCAAIPKKHRAKAGYDLRLVAGVGCHFCSKTIGKEPWIEIRILARFGQMFFAHKRCDKEAHRADRKKGLLALPHRQ